MSSRPLIKPHEVISDGDMSDDIISEITIIGNLSMISYDISWADASSVSGTLSVQVSNSVELNAEGEIKVEGNWTTLELSSVPTVSGASGSGFIDIGATAAYAIRLVYTSSAGTGTMQAKLASKVM